MTTTSAGDRDHPQGVSGATTTTPDHTSRLGGINAMNRRGRRPGWCSLVASVAVVGMLVACTGAEPGEDVDEPAQVEAEPDDPAEQGEPGEQGEPPADDAAAGLPAVGEVAPDDVPSEVDLDELEGLPVLSGLAWALQAIGPQGPPEPGEVEAALTGEFLQMVPAEAFIDELTQRQGEWSVVSLIQAEGNRLVAEIAWEDEQAQLVLEVTDDDLPELAMLGIAPPMADPAEFDDWDEAEQALTGLGDEVVFLAARIDDDGVCEPIASHEPSQRGPLASTFKLYVLGALIDAVEEGNIGWEDELEITEELMSLPSGVLQTEDPGTTVTVAEAAELMIEVSDNTGTDLLIDLLGRETIEDAQADYGHTDPSVNRPFITTREMFQLAASPQDTEAFVAADEAGRRQVLEDIADQPLPDQGELELEPSVPQQPEWYASPAELCDTLVALDEATTGQDMQPARDAFGGGPPPRIDDQWELIGAKGGNQPGVHAQAWLVARDDTRFAFTISIDHSDHIDTTQLIPVLEGAVNLMADDLE